MSTTSQLDIKLWKADPQVTRAEIETQQQQFRALCGVNDCISTSHPWGGGGGGKQQPTIPTKAVMAGLF